MTDEQGEDIAMDVLTLEQQYNREIADEEKTCFEDLPIPLYNEIFKFLDLTDRNKIRLVSNAWNRAIKYGFGVRVVIDNNNFRDLTTVEDVLEAQVRNLTTQIPKATTLSKGFALEIRLLDICGMILSKNLINFLTQFSNLTDLKLSRVFLETDLRLELTDKEKSSLPRQLECVSMQFLKTIHKTGGFEIGRNTEETFGLTISDKSILELLDEFHFENLKTLELYHDMSEEVREIRNSDMIERTRLGNLELINPSTEAMTRILRKIFSHKKLKKLWLDNLPVIQTSNLTMPSTSLTIGEVREKTDDNFLQLTSLQLDGISNGEWSTLIRKQNQLRILDLVILDTNLLESIKLAVTNSSSTLFSFCLVVATPSDMSPGTGGHHHDNLEIRPLLHGVQNPVQNVLMDDIFDLMFLFQCHQLFHLTIKYSPKKLDMSFLPISLTHIELCGNISIDGLLHYISIATNLKRLILNFCDGPLTSQDFPPEHPISFNIDVIKSVIKESHLDELAVSEVGAKEAFQHFVETCAQINDISVKVDMVNYKMVTLPEGGFGRRITVNVPRLNVKMSSIFDRINNF